MIKIIKRITNIFFPKNTWRRKILSPIYYLCKPFLIRILNAERRIFSLFAILKDYIIGFKPRKQRKINLNSKKIVFIDHYYHMKTKSSEFLINYLKQFFDVEIIWDESYYGKPLADLSFIDESYLGVIFWQSLPNYQILSNIKNDNIILFPMYDGIRHDYAFWNNIRDLKIINFSRTLHEKLIRWKLDSIYVQYFPNPNDFTPGRKEEVFFWQRSTHLNINIVSQLFKEDIMQIHVHKAIDPNEKFIEPNKEIKNKFNITYSDWFETKEEMWDVIKQKAIYVSPREYEGIGMSFLEAMAMGKAVIAIDNPTMNEYIKNGDNGYLFKLKNIKNINLSNVNQIQKNAYQYMCNGYKKWEVDKSKIINFIKK